jgi:indolepyruvate ferredoxin oxidoreductase alpha subunit
MVRACGAAFVTTTDPYDLKQTARSLKEAMGRPGVAVVIARRECALEAMRKLPVDGRKPAPYDVNPEVCVVCGTCFRTTGCPALSITADAAVIDTSACTGCSVCAQICPTKAISC